MSRRSVGIDAMRAGALFAVMGYHSFPAVFPHGYLGVDVFFVLSGYLMWRQLVDEERPAGAWLLRRMTRISLPSLLLLAVFFVIGALYLLPEDLAAMSFQAVSILLFGPSGAFPAEGYFAAAPDRFAFVHLWSIIVEIEAYLAAAAFAIFFRALPGPRRAPAFVVIVGCGSFLLWLGGLGEYHQVHTRLWQFALGALIAWWRPERLMAAGVVLAAVAGFAFAPPSWGAVFAAVLAAGGLAASERFMMQWMSPLAAIGRASFGAYLWHWPGLVLAGWVMADDPGVWERIAIMAGAVIAGEAQRRWVEAPAMRLRGFPGTMTFVIVWFVTFTSAFAIMESGGAPGRMPRELARQIDMSSFAKPGWENCNSVSAHVRSEGRFCAAGPGRLVPSIAVLGDSHAVGLSGGLKDLGVAFLDAALNGCPPSIEIWPEDKGPACARLNELALEEALERVEVDTVILYARWSRYVAPRFTSPSGRRDRLDKPVLRGAVEAQAAYLEGIGEIVDRLKRGGKRVILVTQGPVFGGDPRRDVLESLMRGRTPDLEAVPRDFLETRFGQVREALLKAGADVLVDPLDVFCERGMCQPGKAGRLDFSDGDHLSRAGAERLGRKVMEMLAASAGN